MSNQIESEIFEKLPYFLSSHLLFFNSWKDPDDFYALSLKGREELIKNYKHLSVTPTKTNYWIWFGSYTKPYFNPRLNNESIPKLLYEMLITSCGSKRLRGVVTQSKSDVNPFKYQQSNGQKRGQIIKTYQELTGDYTRRVVSDVIVNSDPLSKDTELVNLCLEDIKIIHDPQSPMSKAEIIEMLLTKYPLNTIELALGECGITFI